MKTNRTASRSMRREQRILQDLVHDSYRLPRKLTEPARCRECGAVYRDGRWTWAPRGGPARSVRCPACQRIRDAAACGYIRLGGEYFAGHKDDVLRRVRACEREETREHPLERIIAITPVRDGTLVTTTGVHLARRIAHALQHSFKGELESRYHKAENVLRANWSR